MEYRKTQDKSFTQNQPQNNQNKKDSIANVHFSESGVPSYVSGVRKPIAIRIDTGVYKRYKPLSKRVYGSTCKGVETYMVAFIEAVEKGVHFSNTDKPIQIEKIVIERGLRERRSLELREVEGEKCLYCHKYAEDRLRSLRDGRVYPLCGFHVDVMLRSGNWVLVEEGGEVVE